MTQTTVERIERMLGVHYDWFGRVIEAGADTAAERIADEIDGLRAELAEARAEVERLRPAAEAWELQAQTFRAYDDAVRARAAKEGG